MSGLHSPTHDLALLEERACGWVCLARGATGSVATVPVMTRPTLIQQVTRWSRGVVAGLRVRVLTMLNERLPIWRSVKVQQREINRLIWQVAQQANRIERLQYEQKRLRDRLQVSEWDGLTSAWYQSLQDAFRGNSTEQLERFQRYLNVLDELPAPLRALPVLDLGCGQGDWLLTLADYGVTARGVDSNEESVARANARRCDVAADDLVAHLVAQSDDSLAAVTCMQVVEHITWRQITELFHHSFRALAPGGLILIETPNPENLQVSGYNFWLDPTHQHPIPPPLLLSLARFIGFEDCSIERSAPWPQWRAPREEADAGVPDVEGEGSPVTAAVPSDIEEPLNSLLFGPQDYALIARKPGGVADAASN